MRAFSLRFTLSLQLVVDVVRRKPRRTWRMEDENFFINLIFLFFSFFRITFFGSLSLSHQQTINLMEFWYTTSHLHTLFCFENKILFVNI